MILFACDWCEIVKQPGEQWILGMGLEQVALTAARREIDILPIWDDARAVHPLAVHFCCQEHKDNYVAMMFETEPVPTQVVVETELKRRPVQVSKVIRTVPAVTKPKLKKAAGRKSRSSRRRAA
jgi:hypothetical protein